MSIRTLFRKHSKTRERSLKQILIVGLLLSAIVPILLIGAVSYYFIYGVLDHKAAYGVTSTLHQVRLNLEKMYDNLNYVSLQLTNNQLQLLENAMDPVTRYLLQQEIYSHLEITSYTNPDIGLFYIYRDDTKEVFYQNQTTRTDIGIGTYSPLSGYKGANVFAPHRSNTLSNGFIFSVSRPINIMAKSKMKIYVESRMDAYQQLLNSEQYGMQVVQVLTDRNRIPVFSQNPGNRSVDTAMPDIPSGQSYKIIGDSYYFVDYSQEQDWYLYTIVDKANFQVEIRKWTLSWGLITILSLLFSVAVGWAIWHRFYSPIRKLNHEIQVLGNTRFNDDVQTAKLVDRTHIIEVDRLLNQLKTSRMKIGNLLNELKDNEEEKRHLEVEKLVAQMNPHFLYNTLNTVQWLAKSKEQQEIVDLVTVFIRILRYNLGKDGEWVPLHREIEAMKDYVKLQQIRYNCEFTVHIAADEAAMNVMVPRFLLQPLIENALYHGQVEEGNAIRLSISAVENQWLLFQVEDQGKGMSEEQIRSLLQYDIPERDKVGMGIGLNYVNKVLRTNYGENAKLEISSSAKGTVIYFKIPIHYAKEAES